MKGILKVATEVGNDNAKVMFRNVVMKELIHGSSLIWRDEGKGEERRMYSMHRLVRRFILNDMGRGSSMWNHVYTVALTAVHEIVKTELEKEGKSFRVLPAIFENNHLELTTHSLALVHHHVLPAQAQGSEVRDEVKDIHKHSGRVMQFMGKLEDEAKVWEQLLAILYYQQAKNGRRSKPRRDIASSLNNLGVVYYAMGKLDKALEKYKQSLYMYRAVNGHNTPHPNTASALRHIGDIHRMQRNLNRATEFLEDSLEMLRIVHVRNTAHPHIIALVSDLAEVYEDQGRSTEALSIRKGNTEIRKTSDGEVVEVRS